MYSIDDVAKTDKDIADLIEAELARQNSHIELIASENACDFDLVSDSSVE